MPIQHYVSATFGSYLGLVGEGLLNGVVVSRDGLEEHLQDLEDEATAEDECEDDYYTLSATAFLFTNWPSQIPIQEFAARSERGVQKGRGGGELRITYLSSPSKSGS